MKGLRHYPIEILPYLHLTKYENFLFNAKSIIYKNYKGRMCHTRCYRHTRSF